MKNPRKSLVYRGFFLFSLFFLAERQALELILSQNIIKPQITDNQVQITI